MVITEKEANSSSMSNSSDIVTMMEQEWPEMTEEFKRLQREQYELFCHKQHDYGPGNISVGTQLQTKEEIHLSLTGLWFRMNDKIVFIKNSWYITTTDKVIYQFRWGFNRNWYRIYGYDNKNRSSSSHLR